MANNDEKNDNLGNFTSGTNYKNLIDNFRISPSDLFIAPNISDLIKPIEIPDIEPIGEVFDTIIQKQDEQLKNQNQVIENQNQQIIELQNLSLKKDKEIQELKTINDKKDAEFIEYQNGAKKEKIKWWFTTGIAVVGLIVAIVGIII